MNARAVNARPLPPRRARDGWLLALWLAMAAWSATFTTLAFRLHTGMRTHRADLGQVAQAVWNSSRGRFVEQTDNGFLATRLTDHVEPILALISPVLWLWQDVRALLLLQVLAVAAGAWFVYELALLRMGRVLSPGEWGQVWRREPLLGQARPLAFALALAWLLAPQLQSAVLTEFHAAPLAVPLILWALWAVELRRWGHFVVAALLVAGVKEEIALLAALLGLWACWRAWGELRADRARAALPAALHADSTPHAQSSALVAGAPLAGAPVAGARHFARAARPGLLWGAAIFVLALGWFAVATFVIVPRFAAQLYGVAESGYFARYGALGDSPLDILRSLVTQPALVWQILSEPARLHYLWRLIAPFALLPLLGPELILLSLPVLLANVLSAYPAQFYDEFHYSAPLVPFVAAAAAFGLGRVWSVVWRRTQESSPAFQHLPAAGAGAMAVAAAARNPATVLRPLLVVALALWIGGWAVGATLSFGRGPVGGRFDPTPITAHHRLLPALLAQLPGDAAVTATAAVHPHLAMRRFIYQFPLGIDAPPPAESATWALLDVTTNTDMAPGDLLARVEQLLAGGWSVVDARDGFLLLRRGEGATTIPAAFYSFTEPAASEPLGATLAAEDWPRWRQTRLVATWPGGDEPALFVHAPSGALLYTLDTATPPALLWRAQGVAAGTLPADAATRATTLPLVLPRSVLVHQGNAAAGVIMRRSGDGALRSLPAAALKATDYAQTVAALTSFRLIAAQAATPETGAGMPTPGAGIVSLWLEERPTWPGDTVELWLQWRGDWASAAPRLELRHNGAPVLTDTAPPGLFGREQAPGADGYANDWRSFTLPANADAAGVWSLHLLDAGGAELAAFPLDVRRAVADQACALNSAACAAQPTPGR